MSVQPTRTPEQQAADDARECVIGCAGRVSARIGVSRNARETPASAATDRGRGPTSKESNMTNRTPIPAESGGVT